MLGVLTLLDGLFLLGVLLFHNGLILLDMVLLHDRMLFHDGLIMLDRMVLLTRSHLCGGRVSSMHREEHAHTTTHSIETFALMSHFLEKRAIVLPRCSL